MRKSSLKVLVLCLFLVAGMSWGWSTVGSAAGGKNKKEKGWDPGFVESGPAVTPSDCSFLNDPEVLGDPLKHRHELSFQTEWLTRQLATAPTTTAAAPIRNYVDEEIFRKIEKDKVPSAPLTTDEEFLRRVTLDLTGRIPTQAQVEAFLADTSAGNKRDRYIETLIGSPEFVDRWTMFFGDLLKNSSRATNVVRYAEGRNAFYYTIKYAIEQNRPYNQFVTELLTKNGSNFEKTTGAVNYSVGTLTPMGPRQDTLDTAAAQTVQRFLGIETLDCLLCHSGQGHLNALNVWGTSIKREEAWGMAAFFSRMGVRTTLVSQQPFIVSREIFDLPAGDYQLNTDSGNRVPRQPVDGKSVITPKYLFTGEAPARGENYRQALARMLTKDRQFARATVNYLWAHFFGMGIVDPPTGFDLARLDPKNPPAEPWTLQPSHPELLEKLTDEFIESNYNLQAIMRTITKSSAYQLSSRFEGEWKEEYTPYFARKLVRRLDAEETYDALGRATGVTPGFNIQYFTQPVQWAMQLPDTTEPFPVPGVQNNPELFQYRNFLDTFGRGDRDSVPRTNNPSILQSLSMMNSTIVTNRIRASAQNGTLAALQSKYGGDERGFVEAMFLTTVGRKPSTAESGQALSLLRANRTQGPQDLLWVLVNKIDFLYNY
ncbi:MAG: DUF1549 and DUF1553 domain-containing protein [Blastocatellia bacterium]|nr:DUF1549 and DUF1553 domain-containing protein [Blastocatellia bacterium]